MSLDDILGQEAVVNVLRSAIGGGRVASAYLFYGPDAVGKRMTAHAFAGALLCPEGTTRLDACGVCKACVLREAGNHSGLVVLKKESPPPPPKGRKPRSMIAIEQVHEFGRQIALRPSEGGRTVGIIEEAEVSSDEAQNALLKTLEEPRPGATIILVSGNRELLPDTIRSRCQGVRFRPLPAEVLSEILVKSCGVPEDEATDLAAAAVGSVSRALRIREMGLHEGQEALWDLLDEEGSDPVGIAEALYSRVSGGNLQETRIRTRELLLLLLERSRRRFLGGDMCDRAPERARICFDGIRRAVDTLGRNVAPATLLKAMVIEILPAWNRKRTTPRC